MCRGNRQRADRQRAERLSKIKGNDCEVYSRVTGYYRPLSKWNPGKKEEYKERVDYEQERN